MCNHFLYRFFTGRYCEIEKKIEEKFKDCKNVPHGYWIRSDCDKCRCYNGTIVCVPKYYFGCGMYIANIFY